MRWPRFFPGVLPSAAVRLFYFQHGIFFNERMCQMNFKEALISHLQGEQVQARLPGSGTSEQWGDFVDENGVWNYSEHWKLCLLNGDFEGYDWEFRLAPRTILVNGVEVPAPETEAPKHDQIYFISDPTCEDGFSEFFWANDKTDNTYLRLGIVYLDKESASARAKAMLITQEGAKP